jgi:hypothetical protein
MSKQTSYSVYIDKAYPGVIADMRPLEVDSKVWEDTVDGIFGIFAARGTADSQVILPAAADAAILGPVVAHQSTELALSSATVAIEAEDGVNVLRTGNIYVATEDACAPGDGVYVRYASGAEGTQLGAVRATAVTDETIDLTAEWEFEETGVAGDVVKIRKK